MNSKSTKTSPLALSKSSKKASANESASLTNRILAGIRDFRNEGWFYHSELNFGCEHREYDDLRLPCISDVPEYSAVFWIIQLMTDLLGDRLEKKAKGEFVRKHPRVEYGLEKTAEKLAKFEGPTTVSYQRALQKVCEISVAKEALENPTFYRIDKKSDWDFRKKPNFSDRLFRWVLACLKAKHPILISYPLIKGDPKEFKLKGEEASKNIPAVNYPHLYVPAVVYEATTSVTQGQHLPVYQHGVRCRLFLPKKEDSFRTIPASYFQGWIKDCWLLTNPPWIDCIDKPSRNSKPKSDC